MKNGRYESKDGTVFWLLNNLRHRENGPAVEYSDGTKQWYIEGLLHREDGPAIENSDGGKDWYLYNGQLTEEEFNQWLEKKVLNEKLQATLPPRSIVKRGKI